MKEKKENMEIRLMVMMAILFLSFTFKGQIENLKLPSKIDFTLPTKAIITNILKDEAVQLIRVDTSTEVFPYIVYRTSLTDSISLVFHRENFSQMAVYFNDPCYFLNVKVFCLEYFKISKESKKAKRQLFYAKDYLVTLYETKGIETSKHVIYIRSKKHPIHI